MKGYNELSLNSATMVEAVQYWLDAQMMGVAPRVVSVKPLTDFRFEIGITVPDVPTLTDSK